MPTPPTARKFSRCVSFRKRSTAVLVALFSKMPLPSSTSAALRSARSGCPPETAAPANSLKPPALRATAHLASCSAAKPRIFFTVMSTPSRVRTKNITDSKKRSRVFNTPAALLRGFHLPADFLQTRRKPPRKNGQNATIQYTALGVYYPCMPMAIQRGNVSSRAEYYVFRKFSVRDIPKAVRERKKK